MASIDYYFTLSSPWTFLGDQRFRDIAAKHGATIRHIPVNMGRVFEATGGLPLGKRSKQRQALRIQELRRWRSYLKIPLNIEPKYFPVSDKLAAGVVIAAQGAGNDVAELCHAFMRAVWIDEKDIADPDTVVAIANSCGLDGKLLRAVAETPATASIWERNTDNAIEVGVMGAPFYVIGEEKFWGQDRLDFVDRFLQRKGS